LLSHSCFSGTIKFYLLLALGMAFSPLAWVTPLSHVHFIDILREFFIGCILGGASRILFDSLKFIGEFIGSEMGLSNILSPLSSSGTQHTVLADLLENLAFVFLWTQEIASIFFIAWKKSYEIFPLISSEMTWNISSLPVYFLECMKEILALAFKMSMPFLLAGWVSSLILGLLNRFLPNIQIFSLSSSLQILLGLFMFKSIFQELCSVLAQCVSKTTLLF
jgi:flagellar biosynthetic protein FliR